MSFELGFRCYNVVNLLESPLVVVGDVVCVQLKFISFYMTNNQLVATVVK